MQKGIYQNVEKKPSDFVMNYKRKMNKGALDIASISMKTINEEKDKKGLLKKLSYKDKYLIYHRMQQ
jgi:hypothetical protein